LYIVHDIVLMVACSVNSFFALAISDVSDDLDACLYSYLYQVHVLCLCTYIQNSTHV
jgi:hypothetical protein